MVLISNKPWHGSVAYDNEGYKQARGADAIIVDRWPGQAEQFNFGLAKLRERGFDWAIICDADEFYTPRGINLLVEDCEIYKNHFSSIRAGNMDVYWKSPLWKIKPKQIDNPVIAIRTDQIFADKRRPTLSEYSSPFVDATMHHFSYVRTPEEMLKKINSFEHSNEFDTDEWYKNVFMSNLKNNLHPVVPEQFASIELNPAPKEILENYYADARSLYTI